jgi:Cu/Ag efflux protein CusF
MDCKKLLLVSVGSVLVVLGVTAALVLWHPAKSRVVRHPVTGCVLEVKPDTNMMTVRNDDMPGVMRAMVMDYRVKDAATLKELKPGTVLTDVLAVQFHFQSTGPSPFSNCGRSWQLPRPRSQQRASPTLQPGWL